MCIRDRGGKSEINKGAETLVRIPFRALLTYALLMLVFVASLILVRVWSSNHLGTAAVKTFDVSREGKDLIIRI